MSGKFQLSWKHHVFLSACRVNHDIHGPPEAKRGVRGRGLIGSISGAMLIALFAPPGCIKHTGERCQFCIRGADFLWLSAMMHTSQITQWEGSLSSPTLTVMMVGFSIHFPILRNGIGCDCFHECKKDQRVLMTRSCYPWLHHCAINRMWCACAVSLCTCVSCVRAQCIDAVLWRADGSPVNRGIPVALSIGCLLVRGQSSKVSGLLQLALLTHANTHFEYQVLPPCMKPPNVRLSDTSQLLLPFFKILFDQSIWICSNTVANIRPSVSHKQSLPDPK